jgi:Cupredoxin-like domain
VRTLLAAAVLLLAAPAGAAAPKPARLQVVAHEYSLTLSRQTVPAGPVVIELVNFGMDPHDLRLQRIGGARIYGTPVVDPGTRKELTIPRLLAGRYRLWCSVADHKMRGMKASLRVIARKGV